VAVVDGGFAALREAGVPTGPGRADRTNTPTQYSTAVWRWPVVDADFVDRVRAEADWKVVDARAPERYAGESEPIDPVAGHIRGARNFYWKTQVDGAGKLIGRPLLRERYAELLGEVPPERVVCYCGSGVTACHLLLAMAACGLPGGQLYVGSWSEWCRTREGAI
jgi:thiosulfate/3-mercaptopyruvate sulfurtransferase